MSVETGSAEEPSTTVENAPNLEPTDSIDRKAAEGEAQVHPVVDEEQSREILPPNNINEIVIEIQELERRTAILGTIGSTAVYIGLLGTVWGIIQTFGDIAQIGTNGMSIVIRGISEALICTAAGLVVTIPAVMAYNYFMKKINRFVTDMELCASETAGLLKQQKKS